ncbi:hypothetical protein CF394_08935 [Tetzosporium hominis]|uniref:Uncharacterized protein n=1 Tax=Tetzosporium hominis TaxID=2020506 RepID=A0A264W2T0_9BACL|nr:hypothetical protein CF394_08935 [Tetzosporium hominis]
MYAKRADGWCKSDIDATGMDFGESSEKEERIIPVSGCGERVEQTLNQRWYRDYSPSAGFCLWGAFLCSAP